MDDAASRPLTARSVVASLLLGVSPPRLPGRRLVSAGKLFNIEEGTIRVALSRMVSAGELVAHDGDYELAGRLLERQRRQVQSRAPTLTAWSGGWMLAVVHPGRRDVDTRSALRGAMASLRFAELREGVWLRPDNLDPSRLPDAATVAREQCHMMKAEPERPEAVVAALWDLPRWGSGADELLRSMAPFSERLRNGDLTVLEPAFRLAASAIRHLMADPLLPKPLLPPRWPGDALRDELDRYEDAYKRTLADFLRANE